MNIVVVVVKIFIHFEIYLCSSDFCSKYLKGFNLRFSVGCFSSEQEIRVIFSASCYSNTDFVAEFSAFKFEY